MSLCPKSQRKRIEYFFSHELLYRHSSCVFRICECLYCSFLKKYNYSLIMAPFNQYLRVLNMLFFFFLFLWSVVTYNSNMTRIIIVSNSVSRVGVSDETISPKIGDELILIFPPLTK